MRKPEEPLEPTADIKRYDVHVHSDCGAPGCIAYPDSFESADGIWVDYNDHLRVVNHLRAYITAHGGDWSEALKASQETPR